jgi:hypothetical protein
MGQCHRRESTGRAGSAALGETRGRYEDRGEIKPCDGHETVCQVSLKGREQTSKLFLIRFQAWELDVIETSTPNEVLIFHHIPAASIESIYEAVGNIFNRGGPFD